MLIEEKYRSVIKKKSVNGLKLYFLYYEDFSVTYFRKLIRNFLEKTNYLVGYADLTCVYMLRKPIICPLL